MASKKIYVAIPYAFDPEKSFEIANRVSAQLMMEGHVVFSPISQGHPLVEYLGESVRTETEFWSKQIVAMVDWADEVYVVRIGHGWRELIENSQGVQMELSVARTCGKKIINVEFDESTKTIKIVQYENAR